MRIHTFVIAVAFALALFLFAQHRPGEQSQAEFRGVLDLTHSAPSSDAFLKATRTRIHASSQFATQIDAPSRLMPTMWTAGQIPPERLIAPLVVLDVTAAARANSDYQVGVEDIAKWENVNGQIPLGAVVMARTGWESRWSSPRSYRNADSKGVMHFPGYSEDAAKFLVEARNVMGLGIDTPGVDCGSSNHLPVEQFTLAHSVYHLENVANLDRTPTHGSIVVVAPLKVESREQSPVRIFALVR
jgi:kynurenine formamidase